MLVRNPGGEWAAVESVEATLGSTLLELCRVDVGALFELGEPRHLVAVAPVIGGFPGPDAICLAPSGRICMVVGTADEAPERTVMRLVHAAGTMRHWTTDEFFEHLGGVGSVGGWSVDDIEAGLTRSLRDASFEVLVAAGADVELIAASLDYLVHGGSTVRCFELRERRGPTMEAVEAIELMRDELEEHRLVEADVVSARYAPSVARPDVPPVMRAEEPAGPVVQEAYPEPEPEPEPESEPESEPVDFEDEPRISVWRRHGRVA